MPQVLVTKFSFLPPLEGNGSLSGGIRNLAHQTLVRHPLAPTKLKIFGPKPEAYPRHGLGSTIGTAPDQNTKVALEKYQSCLKKSHYFLP